MVSSLGGEQMTAEQVYAMLKKRIEAKGMTQE